VPLEIGIVLEAFFLGGLREQDHVGQVAHQVVALGVGAALGKVLPDVLLGQRQIALVDLDAVDRGDDRVRGCLGEGGKSGGDDNRRRGGRDQRAAPHGGRKGRKRELTPGDILA
jgi:hypothetical protein